MRSTDHAQDYPKFKLLGDKFCISLRIAEKIMDLSTNFQILTQTSWGKSVEIDIIG